ncbi:phosphoribosylglycinamide synthetase [Erythrobacteraceae bacterium CFH 75059]|uniref:phosphoribosylglycinamide synthetase n=1 Tax=Qipengyuania thermophila TaxID=2509361 RepID=UPI001021E06C|nr:phosphoribosylglycinamide synthetase [Qipengyuania thermophila]TCD05315.1 phosphoribosylglycinamide synthetase [Erythrobacteraceae bacterium CFH 75059]
MRLLKILPEDKRRLKVMFLAKHALADGTPDPQDGNHAVYHVEMRETLRGIGLHVEARNDFDALFTPTGADFVVTLLNRAGFLNSEMLAPLLLTREGTPFLGASPIIRGLGDDKHLMKTVARQRGVAVTEWNVHRRGALSPPAEPHFAWERLVVKPNASSASWGVGIFDQWDTAAAHIADLHAQGHDAIAEPFFGTGDVVLPVVGGDGPVLLPAMRFAMPGAGDNFRSYEEKRALVDAPRERLEAITDELLVDRMRADVMRLLPELWPFDYGRFEFRHDAQSGTLRFMEVNLSCNLWSKKTVSGAARLLGVSHAELVETIVAHSMLRQGVIAAVERV